VSECLKQASQQKFTSISFPAIGTGGQHYPAQEVAATMLGAVNMFSSSSPSVTMKLVRIIVYLKDDAVFKVGKTFDIKIIHILFQQCLLYEHNWCLKINMLVMLPKIFGEAYRCRLVRSSVRPSVCTSHSCPVHTLFLEVGF